MPFFHPVDFRGVPTTEATVMIFMAAEVDTVKITIMEMEALGVAIKWGTPAGAPMEAAAVAVEAAEAKCEVDVVVEVDPPVLIKKHFTFKKLAQE